MLQRVIPLFAESDAHILPNVRVVKAHTSLHALTLVFFHIALLLMTSSLSYEIPCTFVSISVLFRISIGHYRPRQLQLLVRALTSLCLLLGHVGHRNHAVVAPRKDLGLFHATEYDALRRSLVIWWLEPEVALGSETQLANSDRLDPVLRILQGLSNESIDLLLIV